MADLVGSPCEVVVIAAISLIVFTMFFGICTVTVMPAPAPAASGPILVGMTVVVKIVLPTATASVSTALPVLVSRNVYVTVAPERPDCAAVDGAIVTPRTVLAVVVSVELADLVASPCEVTVSIAMSVAPAAAFEATVTLTVTFAPAPESSGPTVVGAEVAQLLPLAANVNVSIALPVLVMRSV